MGKNPPPLFMKNRRRTDLYPPFSTLHVLPVFLALHPSSRPQRTSRGRRGNRSMQKVTLQGSTSSLTRVQLSAVVSSRWVVRDSNNSQSHRPNLPVLVKPTQTPQRELLSQDESCMKVLILIQREVSELLTQFDCCRRVFG